jgi:hypothetical protein
VRIPRSGSRTDDPSVRWNGAFAVYGGHGPTQSSTIVYEIEPGGRPGWHTDATEETQYIVQNGLAAPSSPPRQFMQTLLLFRNSSLAFPEDPQ